jgi:hypothetical protein
MGIGAYCDDNNLNCPNSGVCAANYIQGDNFCVNTCTDPTMSSFAQCGQGACCIEQMDQPVCVPLGCVLQNGRAGCPVP